MGYSDLLKFLGSNLEVSRLERQANLGWDKEFKILQQLGLVDGMKVLDVGSGPGFYSKLLLENLPSIELTALDIDKKLLSISKETLKDYIENRVKIVEGSILNSGLEEGSFDFIIARFVVQHIKEQTAALIEIKRLLKKGGIVVLIDSDKGISTIDAIDPRMKKFAQAANKVEKDNDWNRFCGRNLVRLLQYAGFEEVDFEAVAVHSDIVGIQNMVGQLPVNIVGQNVGPIIWINFVAKGTKK